jgi:hypothetical protein
MKRHHTCVREPPLLPLHRTLTTEDLPDRRYRTRSSTWSAT